MATTNNYSKFTKSWAKGMGEKPSQALLETVESALGGRVGAKVTFALAMYLRPEGATSGQIVQAVGGPQLNKMRELVNAKLAKRVQMPDNEAGHTVYHIELAAKKATKAKAPKKANKKQPTLLEQEVAEEQAAAIEAGLE